MPDPISAVSLGLGAASLAIQVFEGLKTGYGYFQSAANMTEECKIVRNQVMVEYSRLLEWGDAAGLTDEQKHAEYDDKMRINRALIFAILSEIQSLLKYLTKLSLDGYKELEWEEEDEDDGAGHSVKKDTGIERPSDITSTLPSSNASEYLSSSAVQAPVPSRMSFSRQTLGTVDLQKYESIFQSPYLPPDKRRYHKGLNTVMGIGKGIKDIATRPKRLVWALKDREAVEKCLRRLHQLTDYLHETLGDTQMKILLETTQETWLVMLQLTESVKDMEQLLKAMRGFRSLQGDDGSSVLSGGTTLVGSLSTNAPETWDAPNSNNLYERLTWFSIVVTKTAGSAQSGILTGQDKAALELREYTDKDSRTRANYHGKKAWVEWKRYTTVTIDQGQGKRTTGPDALVQQSVERLVALLQIENRPPEFCVPSCKGYILEKSEDPRFGLIYQVNDDTHAAYDPRSLFELLKDAQGKAASLLTRINLAQQLATCLMYLHAVNWLHKGLRSANVLLYQVKGNGDFDQVFLSGLDYARPDETGLTNTGPPQDLSWGVYCHPDYLGSGRHHGYHKTYDFYSLGIILLEIAYWRPAEDILGLCDTTGKAKTSQAEAKDGVPRGINQQKGSCQAPTARDLKKIRARLLKDKSEWLEHVKDTVGERYSSALRACLVGMEAFGLNDDLPQDDPAIAALLQQAFIRIVVDVLKSIIV